MPIYDVIVTEVTKQCIEPISEQIAYRLLDILGLRSIFNNKLFFLSDDLQINTYEDSDDNQRILDNRCDIEIIPGYNPLEPAFDMVNGRTVDLHQYMKRWTFDEYPVFTDSRANIHLYEVAVPCSIELKFSAKVKSIELSDTINMMLFAKGLSNGTVHDYNDIHFTYNLPDSFVQLMYKMYKLQRDLVAEMTFEQYLTVGSNSGITTLVNRSRLGDDKELIMERNNSKVLGKLVYEGDKHETEDFNKVSNRYVINFSYIYQFAKPSILRISHPVMVYNSLIDGQYTGKEKMMHYGEGAQIHPERSINKYFLKHNKSQVKLDETYPFVQYPHYDDWMRSPAMYPDIITKYQTLFIGLMVVHEDEITKKLSLSVDIEAEIFPLIKPEISAELVKVINMNTDKDPFQVKEDIFRRLSMFDIAVFCNDAMLKFERLTLNNLTLTVSGDLDLAKCYRIVISQIRDIRILNPVYIYYMLENPAYYEDFLAFNMQYLINTGYVRVVVDELTNERDIRVNRRNTQSASNLTPRAITIGRYVVEVRRVRR